MSELHIPEYGRPPQIPTPDAYDAACRAVETHRAGTASTSAQLRETQAALAASQADLTRAKEHLALTEKVLAICERSIDQISAARAAAERECDLLRAELASARAELEQLRAERRAFHDAPPAETDGPVIEWLRSQRHRTEP